MPNVILVVDDEAPIRRLLCRMLGRVRCDCLEAADAAEARKVLEGRPCNLMVYDIDMPGSRAWTSSGSLPKPSRTPVSS